MIRRYFGQFVFVQWEFWKSIRSVFAFSTVGTMKTVQMKLEQENLFVYIPPERMTWRDAENTQLLFCFVWFCSVFIYHLLLCLPFFFCDVSTFFFFFSLSLDTYVNSYKNRFITFKMNKKCSRQLYFVFVYEFIGIVNGISIDA